jgi:hypothetical protein
MESGAVQRLAKSLQRLPREDEGADRREADSRMSTVARRMRISTRGRLAAAVLTVERRGFYFL